MTPRGPDGAVSYELRIGGHLDQHWSTWFDGFTLTHESDGTSILRGVVRDQSELHGLLARVRDGGYAAPLSEPDVECLGITLISVTPLPAPTGDDADAGSR